jgi:hypothetical protein
MSVKAAVAVGLSVFTAFVSFYRDKYRAGRMFEDSDFNLNVPYLLFVASIIGLSSGLMAYAVTLPRYDFRWMLGSFVLCMWAYTWSRQSADGSLYQKERAIIEGMTFASVLSILVFFDLHLRFIKRVSGRY